MPPRNALGRVTLLMGALLTSGCALLRPAPATVPPPPPPAPRPVSESLQLADYIQRVRNLPPESLAAESALLALDKAPLARLREAIVLAAPNNAARDDQRALQMAETIARDLAMPTALRDGAALVALWLDDQRAADGQLKRAMMKSRDDDRRIEQLELRVRELERRAGDAEKKLEALRAIEREMSGRGSGSGSSGSNGSR